MFLTRYLRKKWEKQEQEKPEQEEQKQENIANIANIPFVKIMNPPQSERRKQMQINKQKFWEKHPQCNYSDVNLEGIPIISEIPSEYVPCEIYCMDNDGNWRHNYLYCKNIDNKYYYLLDTNNKYSYYDENDCHYYDPDFPQKLLSFVNVTKDDFTKYESNDCILGNMHTKKYQMNQSDQRSKQRKKDRENFGKKHWPQGDNREPMDEKWNFTTMGDLPSEYVLITSLQEALDSPYDYDFYGKKINGKYHYLVSTVKECKVYYGSDIQYYQPEFAQKISKFKNVTKEDFSSYHESECIKGPHDQSVDPPHLYSKKYLIKLALHGETPC